MNERILVLHNIRSEHNVGAIFRTADAAGISEIILSGYTPAPKDRFGRAVSGIAKAALGAEASISWRSTKKIGAEILKLKKSGYEIVALEQSPRSIDYKKYIPKEKVAVILGNEVLGVSPALLKKADAVLEIPMKGKKESLNVSVATGILLFRMFDR